ncbi:hypothetical protein CBS147354_2826 [Penicillium roqueforti]|nr:hypothetical protein CBS147354_2826 [Penicillium roqueforti]
MGTFTFHWPYNASEVFVTGTFDDWGKTVKLDRVGDSFVKEVTTLPVQKVQYKFVVDGIWTTDPKAREEQDGHNNVNNVLLPEEIKASDSAPTMSGVTPYSTTAALAANVPKEPNGDLPGSFPETPGQESEQTFSVDPIPASGGYGNPVTLKPGEEVPRQSTFNNNTVGSTVTLDKESYDKGQTLPVDGYQANNTSPETFAFAPFTLPPITNNMIPESSLPIGGPSQSYTGGPAQQAALADPEYFIQSSGPTSTTAELAAGVPLESKGKANANKPVDEVPRVVKDSIAEAHKDPEATAYQEAVDEKYATENELHKKYPVENSAGRFVQPVDEVPRVVKDSMAEGYKDPEAAANLKAVDEKYATEKELQEKFPVEDSAGRQTNGHYPIPRAVKDSISEAHTNPEATTNQEALAEKYATEKELQQKFPIEESAGRFVQPVEEVPQVVKDSMAEGYKDPEAAANLKAVDEKYATEKELQEKFPVEDSAGRQIDGHYPVPRAVKDSIAEAHKDPEATTNQEALGEKYATEKELQQKYPVEESAGRYNKPVDEVPQVVKDSMAEAFRDPEAAANQEAVDEKYATEKELHKKIRVEESAGAPAPTATAATQAIAPHVTASGVDSSDVSPLSTPTANRSFTAATPSSALKTTESSGPTVTTGPETTSTAETSTAGTTAAATADPAGPTVTTGVASAQAPTSSTAEPADPAATTGAGSTQSPATSSKPASPSRRKSHSTEGAASTIGDKKKKHRLSGFFDKIKEKLK